MMKKNTFRMVHICKKTHKETGLIYICKTQQDPFRYEGSGTMWKQHLKKYGKEHDTEVLFSSKNIDAVRQFCLDYAKTNPEYWKKEEYANMVLESGGYDMSGEANPNFRHGRAVGWKSDKKIQKENDSTRNAIFHGVNRNKECARMKKAYHIKKSETGGQANLDMFFA